VCLSRVVQNVWRRRVHGEEDGARGCDGKHCKLEETVRGCCDADEGRGHTEALLL
jgi:hypothetical protein